jgi:hypothetical protein
MKAASSVEASTSSEIAADWPASTCTASNIAAARRKTRSPDKPGPATGEGSEPWPPNEAASNERPESRPTDERMPVEPWPRADKDSAGKPARSVITIWRARVRIISVVAVGANRGRTNVSRHADPHADSDSLCMCEWCATQANTEHRENSDVSHFRILSESPTTHPAKSRWPFHLGRSPQWTNAQHLPNRPSAPPISYAMYYQYDIADLRRWLPLMKRRADGGFRAPLVLFNRRTASSGSLDLQLGNCRAARF